MPAQAQINHEMLRWARARAGLSFGDFPAAKSKKWLQKLPDWEEGNGGPTFEQARTLSKLLRIPLGFLFLDAPPAIDVGIPDLRTVGNKTVDLSIDAIDIILDAQYKQAWLSEWRKTHCGQDPLSWVGSASIKGTSPQEAAESLIEVLSLNPDWRKSAKNWEVLQRTLVNAVEEAGAIVLRSGMVFSNSNRPLNVHEFRGFAISDPYAPLIFINTRDARPAQSFTLILNWLTFCSLRVEFRMSRSPRMNRSRHLQTKKKTTAIR